MVNHRKTIYVQQETVRPACVLIKNGVEGKTIPAVVKTTFKNRKGVEFTVTADDRLLDKVVRHPEKYGYDAHNRCVRVKANVQKGTAGVFSHKAAEHNFGKNTLPERYRVYVRNGDRCDVQKNNQNIKAM